MSIKRYMYFIVALTKQGRLVDGYVRGTSVAAAMDTFIDQNSLAGQIQEYKFCLVKD